MYPNIKRTTIIRDFYVNHSYASIPYEGELIMAWRMSSIRQGHFITGLTDRPQELELRLVVHLARLYKFYIVNAKDEQREIMNSETERNRRVAFLVASITLYEGVDQRRFRYAITGWQRRQCGQKRSFRQQRSSTWYYQDWQYRFGLSLGECYAASQLLANEMAEVTSADAAVILASHFELHMPEAGLHESV